MATSKALTAHELERSAFGFDCTFETGFDDHRALWVGGAVQASYDVGAVDLTLLGRFAHMPHAQIEAGRTGVRRFGVDLFPGLAVPIRVSDRFVVKPGLGIGLGWIRTERSNRVDAERAGRPIIDDGHAKQSFGARGELSVGGLITLGGGTALELAASTGFMLGTRGDGDVPDYARSLDESERSQFALTSEPNLVARLGVGVRFGR